MKETAGRKAGCAALFTCQLQSTHGHLRLATPKMRARLTRSARPPVAGYNKALATEIG